MTTLRHDNDSGHVMTRGTKYEQPLAEGVTMTHKNKELATTGSLVSWANELIYLARQSYWAKWLSHLSSNDQQDARLPSWKSFNFAMALLMLLCASPCARGAAIRGIQESTDEVHKFHRRELHFNTWMPMVAICGFTVLLVTWTCWRQGKLISDLLRPRSSVGVADPDDASRELLTAEQQAESSNSRPANNSIATRTRRNRRRRTPSQVSTQSLPAYAREPGGQELVVLQGPLEDAHVSQPLATDTGADERGDDNSTGSDPQSPITPTGEVSPELAPLLEEDIVCDLTVYPLRPPAAVHRLSESVDASPAGGFIPLSQAESHHPLLGPRGEAPAYFEVVQRADADGGVDRALIGARSPGTPSNIVPPGDLSTSTSPRPSTPRRSGFRSLLNQRPLTANSLTHVRPGSSSSAVSSSSQSSSSHSRPHTRGTSVTSIMSTFGLSKQKSSGSHNGCGANMVSPSAISLSSISAPLTHTAVRTEFAAYPKEGLTPEQMRLISSKDGLAKFGVPYGPDAVAFASMSGVDLTSSERPPDFESVVGRSASDGRAALTAEPSSPSNAPAERVEGVTEREVGASSSSGSPGIPSIESDRNIASANAEGVPMTASHETSEGEGEKGVVDEEIVEAIEVMVSQDKGKGKERLAEGDKNSLVDGGAPGSDTYVVRTTTGDAPSPSEQTPTTSVAVRATPEAEVTLTVPAGTDAKLVALVSPSSSSPAATYEFGTSPLPPNFPTSSSTSKMESHPPSSYRSRPQFPQDLENKRERTDSRSTLLSFASHASNGSNGTFRTAVESMRSRKGTRWPNIIDGEDDVAGGYDTADDGGYGVFEEKQSRRSTSITQDNATIAALTTSSIKQDRHQSTATITET